MPKILHARGASAPRRVFIAIPAYAGSVSVECMQALLSSMEPLREAGISPQICVESGNCHVDDCRNSLVQQFLEGGCEDLVFIDEDGGFRPQDLVRLLTHDCDVVGGVWPKKQDAPSFAVVPLEGRSGELVEVMGVGTAFLRIRRSVLLQMAQKATHFKTGGRELPLIFERTVEDGARWSGDLSFCRKWRALGGKVYVDPSMRFTHTGLKTWEGCLADFWAEGYTDAFRRAVERLKSGDTSHEVFVELYQGWHNDYAALPDFLCAAYRMAKGAVLETGSGLSTLVMAIRGADVHALEHDLDWVRRTRALLAEFGVSAHVHYCPLKDYGDFVWYDAPDLPASFDLTVCDGPPRKYGREGLFRLMGERIDALLVDDYAPWVDQYAELHVLGTEGFKKFGLRKGHDRTRSNQQSIEADRGAGNRPISDSLGNSGCADGAERDADPVGSERPVHGVFAHCVGGHDAAGPG